MKEPQRRCDSIRVFVGIPRALHASLLVFSTLLAWSCQAATAVSLEQAGAVFNVKAYGAVGGADDSQKIQDAINAAIAAGGGIVYFPAGTYQINATLVNRRSDIVSLVGSGMGSRLQINVSLGISLPALPVQPPFHGGRIAGLNLICSGAPSRTAIRMTDIVFAPALEDLHVTECDVGFHLVNHTVWTERLVANRVTDQYNDHLFHFDNNPANPNNSFGYGTYNGIFLNKAPGQDVFYLTGGAYLYNSTFAIKGNFAHPATGASIFNAQGAAGQPCPGAAYNKVDIAVEGSGYALVKAANNGCSMGPTGNTIVEGIGTIRALGVLAGTAGSLQAVGNAASTESADMVSGLQTVAPGRNCSVQPSNAIAASLLQGKYFSATNWGMVTLAHP